MKAQALLFSVLLWPCVTFSASTYGKSLHKWKGNRENVFKKDQTDPVVFTEDNGAQIFRGIQADSLGENTQVMLNMDAEKEAIMHELEDGGPVLNHDANVPSKANETETNDMSHYESEEINLVGNSRPKHGKSKPVRLPSLTEEGKIDTFVAKAKPTNENDMLKVVKPHELDENSFSKSTELSTGRENIQTDSKQPIKMMSKPKNSEHGSFKPQKTKHHSFASETDNTNIFDVPVIKFPEDDDLLPKSSKLLLGESDDSSPEKLQKSGERLTMFYDRDLRKKKQSVARKLPTNSEQVQKSAPRVNVKGGQIVGGQISGGNIFGGDIEGGFITGGTIRGGVVKGGRMTDGLMDGGLLLDGSIAGGFLHNGTIKGGVVQGGNITGGTITGGKILGGHVSSGFVAGGVLKNGGVEGGVLRGGTIDGGVLKGGVMESGKLLGGIVWNGRVTGGTILGGEILGGEVGEGVVIRDGKINGTVSIGRNVKSGPHKPVSASSLLNPSRLAKLQNQPKPQFPSSVQSQHSPQYLSILQRQPSLQYRPHPHRVLSLNSPARPYSSLTNLQPIEGDVGGRVVERPLVSQNIPIRRPNGASSGNIENDAIVINKKPNVLVLSNISRAREEIKRTYQPNGLYDQQAPANYPNYLSPNSPFSSPGYGYQATSTSATNGVPQYMATSSFPSPESESIQKPLQNGININQFVKQVANGVRGVQRSGTANDNEDIKPTYHWILNQIRNGQVFGTPAGKKFVAKGGIRLNRASIGFDGIATYMDGGSYAGTCISDPNLCSRGLSLEITIKVDPAATMYRAPRYILDSGASSFNSRGVALYTMDNKLRADIAIKDKAYCLVVPLETDKWQDVVLTYHRNGELNMYINCKLVGTTESDEHCINCHTPGCHTTNANTKLMLGRANSDPQSNFARFKAGDLSIYERYLTPQDIDKICGFSKPQMPSLQAENFMPANPGWNSPFVSSYPRSQPGFLKSAISDPQKQAQKKTHTALNVPYFSPWGDWTMCSTTCGLGTRTRQRSCIYTHAQSGWQTCHGVTFQAKKCSSECPGLRQRVEDDTETGTRKDAQPVSMENSSPSNRSHPIKKPVTKTKTNSTVVLQGKEVSFQKHKKENENNKTDVTGSRRNRITRILSKLGNLLGKMSK